MQLEFCSSAKEAQKYAAVQVKPVTEVGSNVVDTGAAKGTALRASTAAANDPLVFITRSGNWHASYPYTPEQLRIMEARCTRSQGITPLGDELACKLIAAEAGLDVARVKYFFTRIEYGYNAKLVRRQRVDEARARNRLYMQKNLQDEFSDRETHPLSTLGGFMSVKNSRLAPINLNSRVVVDIAGPSADTFQTEQFGVSSVKPDTTRRAKVKEIVEKSKQKKEQSKRKSQQTLEEGEQPGLAVRKGKPPACIIPSEVSLSIRP
jgi:hypothetical protein